jgi:hypothetical protein
MSVLLATLSIAGCGPDDPVNPELDGSAPLLSEGGYMMTQAADVYRTPAPPSGPVVGRSMLRRSMHGVTARILTNVIPSTSAVTIWAAVFNDPSACAASPCASSDFAAANGGLMLFTGRVVGGHIQEFAGRIRVGDTANVLSGPGLLNPMDAEVHFIVRSHGPPIPGMVDEQISTAGGGCEMFITPDIPDERGECSDVAFAIHLPR